MGGKLDDVRAAPSRGETDESSLAWREGLAEWQPISQLASELGFTPASTPDKKHATPL